MLSRTREVQARRTGSGALVNVLVLCAVTAALVAAWVLVALDGWRYYLTPLGVRGYDPVHATLKPSGTIAHPLGLCGLLMMLVPVAYSVRKKWKRLRNAGSLRVWLEVHIYCGVVGPVLVTAHTSGRFNGIISVAFWSMVIVVASGFIGRYLFVRIPKSIRGTEMSYDEIVNRAGELKAWLIDTGLPAPLLERLDEFERSVLPNPESLSVTGYVMEQARIRRGLRRLRREMGAAGVADEIIGSALGLTAERASLLGRLAYLHRTRKFFGAWHVMHQPLVFVMFVIVALHVGLVVYLGYTLF